MAMKKDKKNQYSENIRCAYDTPEKRLWLWFYRMNLWNLKTILDEQRRCVKCS